MILNSDGSILVNVHESDIKSDGSFDIPAGVTWIGNAAFKGCESLKKINIPDGVISIGYGAFGECKNLKEINIPESVFSIDDQAFRNCKSLQHINIPRAVKSILYCTFAGCESLQQISIFGDGALDDCDDLQSLLINDWNESDRKRINLLLPSELRDKVVLYSMKGLNDLWREELERINITIETNQLYRFFNLDAKIEGPRLPNEIIAHINTYQENLYYRKAKNLIKQIPLPTKSEDEQLYRDNIKRVVDECIEKAINFNQAPQPSFLSKSIATLGGLRSMVSALTEAFPFLSLSFMSENKKYVENKAQTNTSFSPCGDAQNKNDNERIFLKPSGNKRKKEFGSNPDKNSIEKGKEEVSVPEKKRPKMSFFAEKQSGDQMLLPNENTLGH